MFGINPAILGAAGAAAAGGGGYDPDVFGVNLIRWYKGEDLEDDGYTNNDALTGNWPDNSTTLDDAVPDATHPPIYRDNLLTDSKACVEFQAALSNQDHFDITEFTQADITIAMMVYFDGVSFPVCHSTNNHYLRINTNSGYSPQMYPGSGATLLANVAAPKSAFGAWQVAMWRRASNVPSWFQDDNGPYPENDGDTNSANLTFDRIGAYRHGGGGVYKIAELLVYDGALTDGEWDTLYNGLFVPRYSGDL